MMEAYLGKVSSLSLESQCVELLIEVIRQLDDIEIIQVVRQYLAWIVLKEENLIIISEQVSMEEGTVLKNEEVRGSSCRVDDQLVNSLS